MDDVRVGHHESRLGILDAETWGKYRDKITSLWGDSGGYCLSRDCVNKEGIDYKFNFWKDDETARIDFEEDIKNTTAHVSGEHSSSAAIEYSNLPFLDRTAVKQRPSFLIFEVTGHAMFGIYFGNLKKPELHILNPWNLGKVTQLTDVYALFEQKLKTWARKIAVIDVVAEIEKEKKVTINLQENEKVGFCTLWTGIIADRVIPVIEQLNDAVKKGRGNPLLNMETLNLYYNQVYNPLQEEVTIGVKRGRECNTEAFEASETANRLAPGTKKTRGGKRNRVRKTRRRRRQYANTTPNTRRHKRRDNNKR